VRTGAGVTARTSVSLTHDGRAALARYSAALRQLLDAATPPRPSATTTASTAPPVQPLE